MKKILFVSLVILYFFLIFNLIGCGEKREGKNTSNLKETRDPFEPQIPSSSQESRESERSYVKKDTQFIHPIETDQKTLSGNINIDKPTNKEIQIALTNAGLYSGRIDGLIGQKTKEAIQNFQRTNKLTVDGKVGPKTWVLLRKYLDISMPAKVEKYYVQN
jgi:hypothetical protein